MILHRCPHRYSRISTIRYTGGHGEGYGGGGRAAAPGAQAGLSQAELAARAGVTQSVISAYESGHRQPSVPTLAALIDAAGYDLVLRVRRQPGRLTALTGPLGRRVRSAAGNWSPPPRHMA